jgi:hypothetical protein
MRNITCAIVALLTGVAACDSPTGPANPYAYLLRLRVDVRDTTLAPGDTLRARLVAFNPAPGPAIFVLQGCPAVAFALEVAGDAGPVPERYEGFICPARLVNGPQVRIASHDSIVVPLTWVPPVTSAGTPAMADGWYEVRGAVVAAGRIIDRSPAVAFTVRTP